MKRLALASIGLAGIASALHAIDVGSPALAGISISLCAIWLLSESRGGSRATGFFAGFLVTVALAASSGEGVLLPVLAVAAGLVGWDASLASDRLAGLPRSDRRPIVVRHAASTVAVAVAGSGLAGAVSAVRLRLTFGVAVALFVLLTVAAAAIGLSTRPRPERRPSEETPAPPPKREEAGRRLSPDPEIQPEE